MRKGMKNGSHVTPQNLYEVSYSCYIINFCANANYFPTQHDIENFKAIVALSGGEIKFSSNSNP